MNKNNHKQIVVLILILISVGIIFEIVQNNVALLLFLFGILVLFFSNRLSDSRTKAVAVSILLIALALMSTVSGWIFVSIIIVILFSQNQSVFQSIKTALFESDFSKVKNEYVSIRFDQLTERSAKRTKNQWFGQENDENDIYEWEDINYTKLAGDTVIDLGNTIIPKGQNVILIRKGFGNVKILVPEEVAVSLNLSVLLGKVQIGEDELVLNNEVIRFRSDRYDSSSRQLKIVTNVLLGDVEVVFL